MNRILAALFLVFWAQQSPAQDKILTNDWDYASSMKKVTARFHGQEGRVIHVGDSITYSNPYGQWARYGKGQSAEDKATLAWMHTGKDNESDGWWLARFDHPAGGRSYTACSGIRINEMLAGGKQKMPPLDKILTTYQPAVVVFMLGTNDATAKRPLLDFRADYDRALLLILQHHAIPVVSTIPPHPGATVLARSYNEAIRELARHYSIPLIDYEKEILRRRPKDWNGTLLGKNDVHPSTNFEDATPTSEPTALHLSQSGYLLRCWLTVRKISEVKKQVWGK